VTISSARTSLQAAAVTSLNTITATQLSYLTGLTSSVETRLVTAAASIADIVARLTRWTYTAVAITSATVTLPTTTVTSLNTITATQLSYLTGLTSSVEARLEGNAAGLTTLVNRLLRWSYTAATDAICHYLGDGVSARDDGGQSGGGECGCEGGGGDEHDGHAGVGAHAVGGAGAVCPAAGVRASVARRVPVQRAGHVAATAVAYDRGHACARRRLRN
jgi:hypothetical protein